MSFATPSTTTPIWTDNGAGGLSTASYAPSDPVAAGRPARVLLALTLATAGGTACTGAKLKLQGNRDSSVSASWADLVLQPVDGSTAGTELTLAASAGNTVVLYAYCEAARGMPAVRAAVKATAGGALAASDVATVYLWPAG